MKVKELLHKFNILNENGSRAYNALHFVTDFSKIESKLIKNPDEYKSISKLPVESEAFQKLNRDEYKQWIKDDGTLTPLGKKNITNWIEEYNSKLLKDTEQTQKTQFINKIFNQYEKQIKNFHKEQNIDFTPLPEKDFVGGKPIYKSTKYFRGQKPSEYRLIMVGDEPALARKADHWGAFTSNIKSVEDAVNSGKYTKEEAEELQLQDPFGRIGSKLHNWNLVGSDNTSKKVQIGYVKLADILKNK